MIQKCHIKLILYKQLRPLPKLGKNVWFQNLTLTVSSSFLWVIKDDVCLSIVSFKH